MIPVQLPTAISHSESIEWKRYNNGEEEEDEERYKYEEEEDFIEVEYRPTAVPITREILKKIQQELGLIQLCWPEKDIRKEVYLLTLPDSYCSVNDKERLLLLYAENFRRQFHTKYKDRKPILLACENECGVQKFVSTSIRRSTLPYPELYTWQGCAKFVSDYISYEPLGKEDLVLPKVLRSPSWLINFRTGNSFECATFLTSLLLGQGYNAFVVFGYASREQVQYNRTKITCPYLPEDLKESKVSEDERDVDLTYKLKPPADLRSKFLLKLDARERFKLETEIQQEEEKQARIITELEKLPPDKYYGYRVHAWVVVLPALNNIKEKQVTSPFFIEPSSGEMYDLIDPRTNLLYLGVESIWNDQNYWINMQQDSIGCDKINWNLTLTELWEHLLPGEPWTMRGVEFDIVEEDVEIEREKHLDMPSSYVKEIYINSLDFEKRYPRGHKTIFYKKVKVDLYAPYAQLDGLIEKITIYEDYEYTTPIEIYEKYANRSDHLIESRKNLNTNYIIDYYKRGRSDACKEHRYYNHDNSSFIFRERTLYFYDMVRIDGLSEIHMYPFRLTQYYVNRKDLLYYRNAEFSAEKGESITEGIHYRYIQTITEKYYRNELLPASKDIAVREFVLIEKEIHLKFHYEDERITRGMRVYKKPETGEHLNIHTAIIQEYNSDIMSPPEKNLYLFYELEKLLKEEDQCISNIREAENEIASFIKRRTSECLKPNLLISSFDRNRIDIGKSVKDVTSISSLQDIRKSADYLAPYLARIGNPKQISKAQAYLLREDCLNDFKQSEVDKANLILHESEKLTEKLNELQTLLTQNEDLIREEEEELVAKTNEITFNLQLLDMKLDRHKNLVPVRYKMLVELLQEDERLACLYNEDYWKDQEPICPIHRPKIIVPF